MSHLSILPTVFRDTELLASTLIDLGFSPQWGGDLKGFAQDSEPVLLSVQLEAGVALGWRREGDGSLALVGDLQRLSLSLQLQHVLGRLTRSYAARAALRDAEFALPEAQIQYLA